MAEPARSKHLKPFQWQPGQSGNPAGRQKGARNKLSEAFVSDLFEDWKAHGRDVLRECRDKDPAAYCRVVASLVPKEIEIRTSPLEELSDDDLSIGVAAIAAARQARQAGSGDEAPANDPSGADEPDRVH